MIRDALRSTRGRLPRHCNRHSHRRIPQKRILDLSIRDRGTGRGRSNEVDTAGSSNSVSRGRSSRHGESIRTTLMRDHTQDHRHCGTDDRLVVLTAGALVAGEASTSPRGKQMSQDQVIKLALSGPLFILPKKRRSYQDPVKLKFK